jgi:mannosyltransferase OCH1-like enzyme
MLVNYYIIKNVYEILDSNTLLPNINFFIYYIDNYTFKIVINLCDNDLLNNNLVEDNDLLSIKIYSNNESNDDSNNESNDESNNELIFFNKKELINSIKLNTNYIIIDNVKTKILIKYYNNLIPKFIPSRELYLIKNKYYIKDNNNFSIVIYYINSNECSILIRSLDDELKNIEFQVIIESLFNKRKEIIFIDRNIDNSIDNNYISINFKTNIILEKLEYNIQNIPKNIFQTGLTNNVKNIMHYNSIMTFIDKNPDYNYYYYDNIDSRRFLRIYFDKYVNDAYDLLVPGAYKADLLRYCLLYIYGGCYFDCKQILIKPLYNIIKSDDNLLLCKDFIEDGILNAVILCVGKLDIMKTVINECCNNIMEKVKICPLSITGPRFFYKVLIKYINDSNFILKNCRPEHNIDDYHIDHINNNIKLIENNDIILYRFYKGYYDNYLDKDHYGKLFHSNHIYYKNIININWYIKVFVFPNNDDIFQFNYNEKTKNIIIKNISNKSWGYNLILLIINEKTYNETFFHVGPSISQYKEQLYIETF